MYEEFVKEFEANLARVVEIDGMAEITDELKAEQDSLIEARPGLKAKIEKAKLAIEDGNFLANAKENAPVERRVTQAIKIASAAPNIDISSIKIPAYAKRAISMRNFSFAGEDAELKAFRFGQFFMASLGFEKSQNYCKNTGMLMAVLNEGQNTAGGYLVPEEFGTDMVQLLELHGDFRMSANVVPMASDTRTDPRLTADMTATWDGENEAGTESDMAWDQIRLVAKKLRAFTRISNELSADSAIDIGNQVFASIARAFALAEDQAGYNGTGTSAFGGITGLIQSLDDAAGNPTNTSAGGVYVGTNTTWGSLTLNDFENVISILPTYADAGARWKASKVFWGSVMSPLMTAAGGNTIVTLQGGVRTKEFLGYPVDLVDVMPKTTAVNQICTLFGNVAQAAKLGDRMTRTISTSDQTVIGGESVWERDQLAIKGVERIDINVHDVGSTTEAGPVVGLQTKAS